MRGLHQPQLRPALLSAPCSGVDNPKGAGQVSVMLLRLTARLTLTALLTAALPALAQPAPAQAPLRNTDFVALGGGPNFIAFTSPQLITREGARTTASLIMVVDPTPASGQVTAQVVEWIWCADGTVQTKAQISRNAAGAEISKTEPTAPPARPEAETLNAKFMTFVCTGKLPDPQAARYATIEEAIPGARAILARNRAAAAAPGK